MAQNYTYPPGFATASNPSTGTPGTPAPASATLVGGETPGGLLEAISVDNSGNQNVNVVSSVLPTGASTSALQTSGNASLTTIATNTPPLGQALAANSSPVVLPATQITALTPLSTVTVIQPTGTNLHAVIDSGTITASGTVTANQGTAGATPWLQNITQYGSVATTLGSKVSASSIPVVIASDQASVKVNKTTPTALTITQAAITVGTTAVRLTVSGAAPATTRVVLVATPDVASTATFYIGSTTVTSTGATRGVEIKAGQAFVANNDAGNYFIVSSVAAQTVTLMEQA